MQDPGPYPLGQFGRAALAAIVLGLTACQQPGPTESRDNIAEDPTLNLPAVPRPQPPLERAALFAAVARAASATASGVDDSVEQRTLDGRQFEIRIRFGCRGPSADLRESWLGWSRDLEKGTLRVRARPTLGVDDDLVKELGGEDFETVEGFWIPRPWMLDPACPATAAVLPAAAGEGAGSATDNQGSRAAPDKAVTSGPQAADPIPNWPKIGIAQFFTETDPRTEHRSMRPYEAVKTVKSDQPLGSQGFDLVLSGRFRALPGGKVIACIAKNPNNAPECVISVQFDRVRIERPDNREIIAEWGGG